MSSSRTDAALVDVTMPQMGVSVAEGTVVGLARRGRRPDRGRPDDLRDLDRQDRHRGARRRSPAWSRRSWSPVDETVDVGTVLARIAVPSWRAAAAPPSPAAGRPRPPQPPRRPQARAPADAAPPRAAGNARVGRAGTPAAATPPSSSGSPPSTASTCSQVEGTGRGGRVRKQDVLAFVEDGARRVPTAPEPPLHIESPYRPDPVPAPAIRRGRQGQLSRMRRQIGEHMKRSLETAAHLHDLDRGRHEPGRGGARAAGRDRRWRSSRARRSTRCASTRR